jgi:hypothetical protein
MELVQLGHRVLPAANAPGLVAGHLVQGDVGVGQPRRVAMVFLLYQ